MSEIDATNQPESQLAKQPTQDFRSYLKSELEKRCQKNNQFSLRGFARLLEIEPSSLSKILNGKRRITASMFERLAKKLNLSPEEITSYLANVEIKDSSVRPSPVEDVNQLPH